MATRWEVADGDGGAQGGAQAAAAHGGDGAPTAVPARGGEREVRLSEGNATVGSGWRGSDRKDCTTTVGEGREAATGRGLHGGRTPE